MDTVPVWAALIALGIIGTLVTWLWRGNDKRLDNHSEKLSNHSDRITKLEEKVHSIEGETSKLREKWHDMANDVSHSLASWFNDVVKMIKGDK